MDELPGLEPLQVFNFLLIGKVFNCVWCRWVRNALQWPLGITTAMGKFLNITY
jgi:hypothetical protein